MSIIDELEKLQKLKKQGILTETELENEKKKILSKDTKKEKTYNNEPKNINEDEKKINKENKVQNININKKQNNKKFCSKCGNEIQEGEKFCGKCGNKIKSSSQKLNTYQIIMLSIIAIIILIGILLAIKKAFDKDETSNLNDTTTTESSSNSNISNETSKHLAVLDIQNKELKINATELMRAIISTNNLTTEYEYTKQLQGSIGNYNAYSIGNSTLHGTLVAYPFLILENKSTGNVVRICIYYAYNGGTRLNTNSINYNYSLLYDALNEINQQELASTIMTIKNKFDGTTESSEKGLKYGIMEGDNSKGFYLMLGTTMGSLT